MDKIFSKVSLKESSVGKPMIFHHATWKNVGYKKMYKLTWENIAIHYTEKDGDW